MEGSWRVEVKVVPFFKGQDHPQDDATTYFYADSKNSEGISNNVSSVLEFLWKGIENR